MIKKIRVDLPTKNYEICIGLNIFDKIVPKLKGKRVLLISNPKVYKLYGDDLLKTLSDHKVEKFLVPDGEKYKTINTVQNIYSFLFKKGFDRKSWIIALGGGVIGDIAGFAAAIYMRGIPYINVPTTLLAQTDSSIGGKVGVNHLRAKNIIGSFYHPEFVFSDVRVLKTLAPAEFKNGLAEVIKYSLIRDESLFELLEKNDKKSIKEDKLLFQLISRCAQIKVDIVQKDEKEQRLRMILNFGHTIGHALENISGYAVKHGEAVSRGMASAIRISIGKGLLEKQKGERIINLLKKYDLPTDIDGFNLQEIKQAIKQDKKAVNNKIRFILLKSIGEPLIDDNFILHESSFC